MAKLEEGQLEGMLRMLKSASMEDIDFAEAIINNYIDDGGDLDRVYLAINLASKFHTDLLRSLKESDSGYKERCDVLNKISIMLINIGIDRAYDVFSEFPSIDEERLKDNNNDLINEAL